MPIVKFGTDVGAWSSAPRLDAWSSHPGMFTSRVQSNFITEPANIATDLADGIRDIGTTGMSGIPIGWHGTSRHGITPGKWISWSEALARLAAIQKETDWLGRPKYPSLDAAEAALREKLIKESIAVIAPTPAEQQKFASHPTRPASPGLAGDEHHPTPARPRPPVILSASAGPSLVSPAVQILAGGLLVYGVAVAASGVVK